MFSHRNALAKQLKALHVPGKPVILTNCYDAATAQILIENKATKAVATASFAIAATRGVADADLTLDHNLAGIRTISSVVDRAGLPLTADTQDGYSDIAESIRKVIEAGAVGANIEDENHEKVELRSLEDAVQRIKTALATAQEAGVPDFCINARTDALAYRHGIDEAIKRGKAFLQAGATSVFVWGGPKGRGVSSDEIKQLVKAFDGRLNVKMNLSPGFLNAKEIAQLGVSRISIGPELYKKAMAQYKQSLEDLIALA